MTRVSGKTVALLLAAACATAAPQRHEAAGVDRPELSATDEDWFRRTLGSADLRRYLTIPCGSIELERIPAPVRTRLAMLESFLLHPDWDRVWNVVECAPDEFAGVAVINDMVRRPRGYDVMFDLSAIDRDADARGLEAALFAHIEDERSRPSEWNPLNYIEDDFGSYRNAYRTCASWLAPRSRGYMAAEWERLATFTRNTAIRDLARRCLAELDDREGSVEFSQLVGAISRLQERFHGHPLLDRSAHDVAGSRHEVRQFEIRFFGEHEALDHHVFQMTGIRPAYLNHRVVLLFRVPQWPHLVSMAGEAGYLDGIEALFALLERGEPGEVDLAYAKFLVARGEYGWGLRNALPPFSRLGQVPGKGLLVARVLDEHVERARTVLGSQ